MKAFVDTTILTDALLKHGEKADVAKAALKSFDETQLPVYAIKEFKRGPLANYRWLHNKFASQHSFSDTLEAVQTMAGTPRRYLVATALEALVLVSRAIGQNELQQFNTKYGATARHDEVMAREARLRLKRVILKAWSKRRTITTTVVNPLSCYRETDPRDEGGLIVIEPMECVAQSCCMRQDFATGIADIAAMRDALGKMAAPSQEQVKRLRVLKDIARTPKRDITHQACRRLGDAVFAFYAPKDSAILTTNVKDHRPLAEALGKVVVRP